MPWRGNKKYIRSGIPIFLDSSRSTLATSKMRRHCVRSVLLHCKETPGSSSFRSIQRLSFSTSSSAPTPAKSRHRPEQRRSEGGQDADNATAPNKKKRVAFVNPRTAFRNKATVDKGRSPDKPYGSTAPTPTRFINPASLRGHLLQNQKQIFVQGDEPQPVPEGDVQLEEELSLTATHSPGSFVELRRYVFRRRPCSVLIV